MTELFLNFGAYFMLAVVTIYFVKSAWIDNSNGYLSNDLSRDGKHWSYDEVVVAAYVTIWQDDKLRLNDNYQTFIGSVLKRSDRAVAEQMRRIRSVADDNSIASDFIQGVSFDIASMNENDAENEFMFAIESLGGDLVTLNTFSI